MKHSKLGLLALGLILTLVLIPCLQAQVKKDTETGLDRLEGTIQSLDKNTSTITLLQSGKTTNWKIVFSKETKFTYRNKDASVDEVKEGRRIICLGKMDKDSKLIASRIDVRTEK